MTQAEMQRQQDLMLEVLSMISPLRAVGARKVRVGGPNDGGYVMLDNLSDVEICYSLGVGPDVSWDHSMAMRGAFIYQYDHTVNKPPTHHKNFKHLAIGISARDDEQPDLRRLETLIKENGHFPRDDMILKMDIEGAEWDVLAAMDPSVLLPFRQIVCELHAFSYFDREDFVERAKRSFSCLRANHNVVHIHGNNFTDINYTHGIALPDCIEVTLARQDLYDFVQTDEIFPISLDAPCNPDRPEMFVGSFKFKSH